ncbi:Deoxycytidine monophosphate (dCMP) deaminase, partial [Rhizophlyctis rosea]
MLIGITGPTCAGKASVADYLVSNHRFTLLQISPQAVPTHRQTPRQTPTTTLEPSPTPPTFGFSSPTPPSSHLPPSAPLKFASAQEAADYATTNWTHNLVLCPVSSVQDWEPFRKRPFALLVAVDAPISLRYARYKRKRAAVDSSSPDVLLEEFIMKDDDLMFSPTISPSIDS